MVFSSFRAIRFEMPTTGAPVTWNPIGKSTCFPFIRQNRATTSGTMYVRPWPTCMAPLGYGNATFR